MVKPVRNRSLNMRLSLPEKFRSRTLSAIWSKRLGQRRAPSALTKKELPRPDMFMFRMPSSAKPRRKFSAAMGSPTGGDSSTGGCIATPFSAASFAVNPPLKIAASRKRPGVPNCRLEVIYQGGAQ